MSSLVPDWQKASRRIKSRCGSQRGCATGADYVGEFSETAYLPAASASPSGQKLHQFLLDCRSRPVVWRDHQNRIVAGDGAYDLRPSLAVQRYRDGVGMARGGFQYD